MNVTTRAHPRAWETWGFSFSLRRSHRGRRWKAESFMKVHRVLVVTYFVERCNEERNERERGGGTHESGEEGLGERGKVLLVGRSLFCPRYRELPLSICYFLFIIKFYTCACNFAAYLAIYREGISSPSSFGFRRFVTSRAYNIL